jgi:hypothetical protein
MGDPKRPRSLERVEEAPGHDADLVEELQGGGCLTAMHGVGEAEETERMPDTGKWAGSHPETPEGTVSFSIQKRGVFEQGPGNQGFARRRTPVRRTRKSAI